jgi:hypothetical protein
MARSTGGICCFPDREEEGENFKMKVNEVDFNCQSSTVKVKVKQSHYMPGQAQRFSGV